MSPKRTDVRIDDETKSNRSTGTSSSDGKLGKLPLKTESEPVSKPTAKDGHRHAASNAPGSTKPVHRRPGDKSKPVIVDKKESVRDDVKRKKDDDTNYHSRSQWGAGENHYTSSPYDDPRRDDIPRRRDDIPRRRG